MMIIMLAFIIALIILDIVAVRRGTDSRDGLESKEWEHRRLQVGIEW